MDTDLVSLSSIDTERWGVTSAWARSVRADALPAILSFCKENEVVLLMARCSTADLDAAQAMESQGFLLMDTLVYFDRPLQGADLTDPNRRATIRPATPNDTDAVREVAAASFAGYFGHYHADPRLDRDLCDAVYTSWAHRSCLHREVVDAVFVAELEAQVVGFATVRLSGTEDCEWVLSGVLPTARRQGIYRSFLLPVMDWGIAQGAKRMVLNTQVNNTAVQKVWVREGYEPKNSYYTFHKWFS